MRQRELFQAVQPSQAAMGKDLLFTFLSHFTSLLSSAVDISLPLFHQSDNQEAVSGGFVFNFLGYFRD